MVWPRQKGFQSCDKSFWKHNLCTNHTPVPINFPSLPLQMDHPIMSRYLHMSTSVRHPFFVVCLGHTSQSCSHSCHPGRLNRMALHHHQRPSPAKRLWNDKQSTSAQAPKGTFKKKKSGNKKWRKKNITFSEQIKCSSLLRPTPKPLWLPDKPFHGAWVPVTGTQSTGTVPPLPKAASMHTLLAPAVGPSIFTSKLAPL